MKTKVFIPIPVSSGELPVRKTKWPETVMVLQEGYDIPVNRLFFSNDTWDEELGKITHWLKETEVDIINPEEQRKIDSDIWDACEKRIKSEIDRGWTTMDDIDFVKTMPPDKETFLNSLLNK